MQNKLALVTGANQGIGFAVVKLLLKKGLRVILSSRDEIKGKEAIKKLNGGENLFFHQLDISDEKSVQNIKEYVQKEFGKLDILINNAGINYDTWQNTQTANIQEVKQTIDTNLLGAWRVTQAFVPLLQKGKNSRIVNISSGAGNLASQTGNTPAYSISKLALNALTMQFANLLQKDNILVNCMCPGWVRTSMGGVGASRSPEEGADTAIWLSTDENLSKTGKFFRDRKVISW